jgi:hypothetical protein
MDLFFAARVRAGFVPASRREVYEQLKQLKITKCPFVNLPQKEPGRWGQGLTAEKMKQCIWLKPEAVVRVDFAEWTGGRQTLSWLMVGMIGVLAVFGVFVPAFGMTTAAWIVFMGVLNYVAYRDIFERRSDNLPKTVATASAVVVAHGAK